MNVGGDLEEEGLDHEDLESGSIFHGVYIPNPIEFDTPQANEPTQQKPHRLVIDTIEVVNFKSYAKKRIIGPFHQCFTAIIGPNGCGKSNIIDALLFVFGFRSKKIRIKSLKNLIHRSDGFTNLTDCSVTVNFREIIDKEDGSCSEVEGSTLSIKRVLSKDGQSSYYVDEHKKSFKIILNMLKEKYGVDLVHNRFLILQGEVEQIALMKPKALNENETGFLEYIDDIIGTNMYEECLQKLNEILKTKYEERFYKIDRIKAASKEKNQLESAMKEAVSFLREENQLIEKRSMLFQYEMQTHKDQMKSVEEKTAELTEEKMELEEQFRKVEIIRKEEETSRNEIFKRVESLKTGRIQFENSYKKLEESDLKSRNDLDKLHKTQKLNTNNMEKMKKYLVETENDPTEHEEQLREHSDNLETLQNNLIRLNKENEQKQSDFYKKAKPKLDPKHEIELQLVAAQDNLIKSQVELKNGETQLDILLMESTDCCRNLGEIENKIKSAEEHFTKSKAELANIRKEIPRTESEKRSHESDYRQLALEKEQLIKESNKLKITMNERRAAMEQTNFRSRIVNGLLREKREGNLTGVFGRLGDLGGIDDKYDIAISTACAALDNILVDNSVTASKCIEFLKKTNLGSAYFISLDKQKHFTQMYQKPFHAPENVHRLFDLINIADDRVKPAFYFALRDTLVANDIEQAARIAYGVKPYRVVTLKGELIEITGTMSGGGNRPMRGRMGKMVTVDTSLSNVDVSLQNVESDLETKETRLKEIQERQTHFNQLILQLSEKLKNLKNQEANLSIEIEHSQKNLKHYQDSRKQIGETMKSIQIDESQKKRLEKSIETLKKKVEEKQMNFDQIKNTLKELDTEIEKLRKKHFKNTSDTISEVEQGIEAEKKAITQIQYQISNGEKVRKQTIDKISKVEKELKTISLKIESLTSQREECTSKAAEIKTKLKEINEEVDKLSQHYTESNDGYQKCLKESHGLKAELINLENQLKEIDNKYKKLVFSFEDFRNQQSKLQLNDIPKEVNEGLKIYTAEDFENCDINALRSQIKSIEAFLKEKRPDLSSVEEYFKCEEAYLKKVNELNALTKMIDEVKAKSEEVRKRRIDEFFKGLLFISDKLKEMYRMLSFDGDAHLELVDSFDPYSEGVTFNVRPPRKTWRNIINLSGGEKTLASMALIFALHQFKPSPLYVMDEIDAALDFRNVSIIGNYIKQKTNNTQFIVISLREHMFKLAPMLIGVYKRNDRSRSVYMNVKKFLESKDELIDDDVPDGYSSDSSD